MRVKELFTVGDMIQSIGGFAVLLDRDNCKVINKTKSDNAIVFHTRREDDGEEGRAYLRVQGKFFGIADQLLNWAFVSEKLMGLTLNEIEEVETGLEISGMSESISVK